MVFSFYDFIFHKSETRTVLLEVGIVLGLLKKTLLKTSKIVLMYSNSLARHVSSMFHAKCLLPRLDRLLLVRSCLQNFYQWSKHFRQYWRWRWWDQIQAIFLNLFYFIALTSTDAVFPFRKDSWYIYSYCWKNAPPYYCLNTALVIPWIHPGHATKGNE